MLVSHKQFSYNFETCSVKDIIEFLHQKGFSVLYETDKSFYIKEIPTLHIRPPFIKRILESNFCDLFALTGDVYWSNYDDYYYEPESLKQPTHKKRIDVLKADERVFNMLRRKFSAKIDIKPKAIKDVDWILAIRKKGKAHFPAKK